MLERDGKSVAWCRTTEVVPEVRPRGYITRNHFGVVRPDPRDPRLSDLGGVRDPVASPGTGLADPAIRTTISRSRFRGADQTLEKGRDGFEQRVDTTPEEEIMSKEEAIAIALDALRSSSIRIAAKPIHAVRLEQSLVLGPGRSGWLVCIPLVVDEGIEPDTQDVIVCETDGTVDVKTMY